VINQIAGTSSLIALFWRDYRDQAMRPSAARLAKVLRQHSRFASLCIASSFLNYAGLSAPTFLLAYFYTPDAVGAFSLAQRFSAIPAVFIGNAISQVYFASACRLIHEDPQELKRLYQRTTFLLFGISVVASLAFSLSPWLVPILFGAKWAESGWMMQYMAPMLIFTMSVSPLTMLEWLEKNVEVLVWHFVRLSLIGAGFLVAHSYHLSAPISIGIFSLVNAVMYLILFFLNRIAIDQIIVKGITSPKTESV
jgi:O-antigen/teichoic acid export membrane protein